MELNQAQKSRSSILRPQTHALALEPRIMFDGAAATAADQHQNNDTAHANTPASADPATRSAATAAPIAAGANATASTPAPTAQAPALNLVVIDARVDGREQLQANLPAGSRLLVVDNQTDGLAAISAALAELGHVDSIQIFSHGASGQFTLGSTTLNATTLESSAQVLSSWRAELNAGADIQLYGCNVGAGNAGQTLVNELARLTGADVGASSDATGSAQAGGNWTLEVVSGAVDKPLALGAEAVSAYAGLLLDAAPLATIDATGSDVLLGDSVSFVVNFTNTTTQVGFAPYIDLYLPATGKDGDDGVTFGSASYLGQTLTAITVTFDPAGNATHPLARDANGNPLIITAASVGMQPGDKMIVLSLPYGSVASDQPVIPINVTLKLSNFADTSYSNGAPNLDVKVRGGFELGNDALNNPAQDPSLAGALDTFTVRPTVLTFDTTINTPEGETATGPNYGRTLTVTATPAPGQTLTNVVVTQTLPTTVQVTAITPGANGTLTSITLHDGTVLTDAAAITAAIASNVYIDEFSVTYTSMTAATNTVVSFYVPEADADSVDVLNPDTGDARTITVAPAEATGDWVPLDPRDSTPPGTPIDFAATGDPTSFIARSIAIIKSSTLQTDLGHTGLTPGDTVAYQLDLTISDFFTYGRNLLDEGSFEIRDQLGDGQTFVGTPTMTFWVNGVEQTVTLVVTPQTVNGVTTLVFDIAASLAANDPLRSFLNGDLSLDTTLTSATRATINYTTTVGQSYTPPAGAPHSEINEGDAIGNNVVVQATIMDNLVSVTGFDETDVSSSSTTVPTSTVDIQLVSVDGLPPPADGELNPGQLVTFSLTYDLVTGDYESFSLSAYLPQPLFNLGSVSWSNGTGAGQWILTSGPGGNTNTGPAPTVTSGPGNSVVFNFGDHVINSVNGSRIQVQFTLRVGDQPFADGRSLDVLAQSSQLTTLTDQRLISNDVAVITSIAEPVLAIQHGVVSATHGTVTGTPTSTVTWNPPGTTGSVPFNGPVTLLTDVEGRVDGIDAGDILRLASAIENTGGGGAFDVVTSITLPAGVSFLNGSLGAANLAIYRGDGTQLVLGTDYSVSGNTITFLDANGQATLLAGRAGTTADTSGANMVVITYDVVADQGIEASRTLQSTATLSNYASVNNGTDFTPTDLKDTADQQVAAPFVEKKYADGSLDDGDSSATHTTGSDLVIGESMLYDIVVTLTEGVTPSLVLTDLIPDGLRLDMSFGGGSGYELLTTRGQTLALQSAFNGAVVIGSVEPGTGLGGDGVDPRFVFSSAQVVGDNDTTNNSFVIRVRLVASNTTANQAGATRSNSAQISYSDLDGDTPNGTAAITRDVALTGGAPSITVREPTLQVTQTLVTPPGLGFDEGDPVEWTITITNGATTSDFNAFDITFLDNLPSQLSNLTLVSVTYAGGATDNNGVGDGFELVGTQLRTVSGANIDIATGGSITIRLTGVVNASAAIGSVIPNTATVQWTSLDGTAGGAENPAGERTGIDGVLNSGALNDYQLANTLNIPVAEGFRFSRVGGMADTNPPSPTDAPVEDVAVGEIIRYRVAVLVPEGNAPNYQLQVVLDQGLEFISPDALLNNIRIAFVSNGPQTAWLSSSLNDLITSGSLNINGNEDSAETQLITPNLNGAAPLGVFNPKYISVTTDPQGRQVVTFNLGNLSNPPPDDADLEGVVIEFNVRVSNVNAAVKNAQLGATVNEIVNGAVRGSSDTLYQRVVEPSFDGLNNRVIDFNPNPGGNSGTATFQLDFNQNGTLPAYDARLGVNYPQAQGYTLVSVTIDGQTYGPNNLPAGVVAVVDTNGVGLQFDRIEINSRIQVVYQATLTNTGVIQPVDSILTWTSLPENFTSWGGDRVGDDGQPNGERTGNNIGPNTYVLRSGAGLGEVIGVLWNDTSSATTSTLPELTAPKLQGQRVELTWGGLDNDLSTGADNRTYVTFTDAAGFYRFTLLPNGVFRVSMPTGPITDPNDAAAGQLDVRIDTDGGVLGQVDFTIGGAVNTVVANAGYVERNDPPTLAVPGTQTGREDVPLPISGISIGDPDADRSPNPPALMTVRLNVGAGTLSLSSTPSTVTVTGSGTATMFLTGTIADVNAALSALVYLGRQDYNGNDRLFVIVTDNGNFGDANTRNGIPGEAQDALSASNDFLIVLTPVNDNPIAGDDVAGAVEAGGTNNNQIGVDPRGGLLGNDKDPDLADIPPDVLTVTQIGVAGGTLEDVPTTGLHVIFGTYGRLVVDHNGLFQYIVNNADPRVEALRTSGQTLQESFDYKVSDKAGAFDIGRLTVTIRGANDAPIASDDEGTAIEAGGRNNDAPGSDAAGNVLTDVPADFDKDVQGEALRVTGIRLIPQSNPGPIVPVQNGTNSGNGTVVVGLYGTLTIGADGSYRYVVDNNNAAVQALSNDGEILSELFSYRVTDVGGLDDVADLRIVIRGRNDNPVATDNSASATAAPTDLSQPEVNPSGNVITDNNGNGVDRDVDRADQPNTVLHVNGIRTGVETAVGTPLTAVATGSTSTNGSGTVIPGLYGTLTIGADGSYTYDVDSTNPLVQALRPGSSLTDIFTYQLVDTGAPTGLTDLAQLVITVNGVNDPPAAGNLTTVAIEAGGLFNGTPGVDPSDTVQRAVSDPDGDTINVTFIRAGEEIAGGTDTAVAGDTVITGTYGTLTIRANGTFTYVVNNANAAVQALRTDQDHLNDFFTFTINDGHGLTDRGQITIEIHGRNDNPVANNDRANAMEAGGTNNQSPGTDPTGNVFNNPIGQDTDVDAGDQLSVLGARTGAEAAGGTFTGVPLNGSITLVGTYGSLIIFYNGNYEYHVNNNNATVNALRPGQTLSESFTYAARDLEGAVDYAQLDVTIGGAWDAPVAQDNFAYAVAANVANTGLNPTGNLITDDNLLGIPFPVDSDVDNGDVLSVSSIRTGTETSGTPGPDTTVPPGSTSTNGGVRITGKYGWLTVGADGTYLYEVDNSNQEILQLGPLGFVTDEFTYTAQDLGTLTDLAQLTVIIRGINQAPEANPDIGNAIEAGGVNNAIKERSPTGNVITNDTDIEGDDLLVVGVRAGNASGGAAVGGLDRTIQGLYGTLRMARDGSWRYEVNDDLPEVQALRVTGQTLTDVFTYTISDYPWGARDTSELSIVIDGRNDNPIAHDDTATAVEAGGVANTTPGVDPTGNVLDNDTDVDSVANGETKQVVNFTNAATGQSANAGGVVQGLYGRLTLNADGSYTYQVDNDNPTVQALRLAGETLTERFSYVMKDAAGANSNPANFVITLQGANDTPVARDDTTNATDQVVAPQTSGNVLPNDSDVDGGDALHVSGIRAGAEAGSGAAGTVGQALAGRYGTLVINADGSYTYTIDLTNPEVLAAAGMGQVLNDYFTYTVSDRLGATDQAQLVVKLDISAPYVGPEGDQIFSNLLPPTFQREPLPQVQPAVFVEPVVRQVDRGLEVSSWTADGTRALEQMPREIVSQSIGAGLGEITGQFVARAVAESRVDREFSVARLLGRDGRVSLSADGLLDTPSLFTVDPEMLISGLPDATDDTADEQAPRTASSFTEQLHAAAARLHTPQ